MRSSRPSSRSRTSSRRSSTSRRTRTFRQRPPARSAPATSSRSRTGGTSTRARAATSMRGSRRSTSRSTTPSRSAPDREPDAMTATIDRAGRVAARPARRSPARRRRNLVTLALLAPALLGLLIFFVYPLIASVYYSFTRFDLVSPPQWIGLRNYEYLFTQDPNVWLATLNTLWFVVIWVPVKTGFALIIAGLLARARRASGVWRTIFYLPALVPPVASVVAFVFLFNPGTGPVNQVLAWFGIKGPLWFNDPAWSKPSLVLLGIWVMGDIMIIFLAALLDVPRDQYEAA